MVVSNSFSSFLALLIQTVSCLVAFPEEEGQLVHCILRILLYSTCEMYKLNVSVVNCQHCHQYSGERANAFSFVSMVRSTSPSTRTHIHAPVECH